ncbi:aquaporin [Caulobacter sp. KR2-114]|uniref:aquaporin n=1 Tax=Caulobacter sp. KR2-114 TaxID=3400912 RepID=UPI003C0CAB46
MKLVPGAGHPTSFFERDPGAPLWRRALAEGVGAFLLVLVIAASFAGTCCLPPGPATVARALAISAALAGLMIAFGPVSGGHFNPLITACQWFERRRNTACLLAYLCAQLAGGVLGAKVAAVLFGAVGWMPQTTPPLALLLAGELVGAGGLMIVVLAVSRAASPIAGAFAAAGWVLATLLVVPTFPFANPAVALAALAGAPLLSVSLQSAAAHVAAEVAGALIALALVGAIYPLPPAPARKAPGHPG